MLALGGIGLLRFPDLYSRIHPAGITDTTGGRCAVALIRLLQQEAPAFFSDFEIYDAEDRREAAKVRFHKV